jgi:Pyruvate phosphate dikinase, AMP/ATP-binding domain
MNMTRMPAVFKRKFFDATDRFMLIGSGSVGGKAQGLASFYEILHSHQRELGGFAEVSIPRLAVIGTDQFTAFMERNRLYELTADSVPDDRIIREFLKAALPMELVGDLRALIEGVHSPLAIRSSSLLEDEVLRPFAGIYQTKMIPNNQPAADARFAKLVEAIKFVYASTYSRSARMYRRALKETPEERMAVIIQEVVGSRHGDRFYPDIAGVARSWNFYPTGAAKPEDGVVQLALGLGKTIVDGGLCWTYSPSRPASRPPYANMRELSELTQSEFWSVNMGPPPGYDPLKETEYLTKGSLANAEEDGVLGMLASTWNDASDRLSVGIADRGTRILTFAPMLASTDLRINDLIRTLLLICEQDLSSPVEIEFALTMKPLRVGCLQVRTMLVRDEQIDLPDGDLTGPRVLVASNRVCGHGVNNSISDIVYVVPERFDKSKTAAIAGEMESINRALVEEGRQSLMIGFGRWGSSDPWLGIPVNWGQISSARAIVEATLPSMNAELSQGSHFFHNLTSFAVSYFSVHHEGDFAVDWEWLASQRSVSDGAFVRHVRLPDPLEIKVDGTKGRGVIRRK